MKRILIYTSYFHPDPINDWFYDQWFKAIHSSLPSDGTDFRHVVLCQAGQEPWRRHAEHIVNTGNLPTLGQIIHLPNPPFYSCSISALLMGMWLAYNDERDFVFVEQDVLVFGDWLNQMYADVGDGDAGFPHIWRMGPEAVALGLFLIKHSGIPEFMLRFMETGPERGGQQIVENKVGRIIRAHPNKYKWLTLGVDRDRPFNLNEKAFFIHKLTPAEMRVLAAKGLVSIKGMPEAKAFTNNPEPGR